MKKYKAMIVSGNLVLKGFGIIILSVVVTLTSFKLTEQKLEDIKKGNITDEEFKEAINFRKKNLKQFDDYIDSLSFSKQSNILFDNDDLDERRKQVDTITKEEIIALANKIELNVEYILKGDKDNE